MPVNTVLTYMVFLLLSCQASKLGVEQALIISRSDVSLGWAQNSVNAKIFRRDAICSDEHFQFIAFYDPDGHVVLGKRPVGGTEWELKVTALTGNIRDAHNVICIGLDGDGYLHVAWDHHNDPLHYTVSKQPYALELEAPSGMTGSNESKVTYPEFYRFSSGDLLFAYRDGSSGSGNLVLNLYDLQRKTWENIRPVILDGEQIRNAYWQIAVDQQDVVHLSWVWRETPDVASNHDLCYAVSKDKGYTWQTSQGVSYNMPINVSNAEIAIPIAQHSNLINQTSMTTDEQGNPYIASYWQEDSLSKVQIQLVFLQKDIWKKSQVTSRDSNFSLSGGGTKKIPIARPQVFVTGPKNKRLIGIIYRDQERNSKISLATAPLNTSNLIWKLTDLSTYSVGDWEPSYDSFRLQSEGQLHIFMQKVAQGDGETLESMAPQMVSVLQVHNLSAL